MSENAPVIVAGLHLALDGGAQEKNKIGKEEKKRGGEKLWFQRSRCELEFAPLESSAPVKEGYDYY